MRVPFLFVCVALATAAVTAKADLPDVDNDTKSQTNSLLTLKQVAKLGRDLFAATGASAATKLSANAELGAKLDAEAASSTKHISALTLKRIAAIESQCDLTLAYSKPAVKGYFQMAADACTDVGIPFADIDEQTEWKKGCEAGRKFLDKNWQRIEDKGIALTDGTKATLTSLYLWHQQGSGAAPKLLEHLKAGTAKDLPATPHMRSNVFSAALSKIEESTPGGHKMTELEYYAYWSGAIDATMEAIH